MTQAEAMREIEGHAFAARVNVGSDLRTFLRAAQEEPAVKFLFAELSREEAANTLVQRVSELSGEPVDPRYENPWDSALAIYLWMLSLKAPHLARIAAEATAQAAQCWWARTLAEQLRTASAVQTNAGVGNHDLSSSTTDQTSDADESIIPGRRIADPSRFRLIQGKGVARSSSSDVQASSTLARWLGTPYSHVGSSRVSVESTRAA